jgi:hypothetical protein
MDLGKYAGRPHTGTGRCCSQFIYSVHIFVYHSPSFSTICSPGIFLLTAVLLIRRSNLQGVCVGSVVFLYNVHGLICHSPSSTEPCSILIKKTFIFAFVHYSYLFCNVFISLLCIFNIYLQCFHISLQVWRNINIALKQHLYLTCIKLISLVRGFHISSSQRSYLQAVAFISPVCSVHISRLWHPYLQYAVFISPVRGIHISSAWCSYLQYAASISLVRGVHNFSMRSSYLQCVAFISLVHGVHISIVRSVHISSAQRSCLQFVSSYLSGRAMILR